MPLLRLRITGDDAATRAIINLLQSMDGIEHVEEVEDLMPHMDDDDSSSAGLVGDRGVGFSVLEVDAPNHATAARVRQAAEELAFQLDAMVEIEDEADD